MAAVRHVTLDLPGRLSDHSNVRPPTDVIAITSLPDASLNTRHLPPGAATCHPKRLRLLIHSALHPALNAVLDSVLCHRFCPPSSVLRSLPLQLQIIQPKHIPRRGGGIRRKDFDLEAMLTDVELVATTIEFAGGDHFRGVVEIVTFRTE